MTAYFKQLYYSLLPSKNMADLDVRLSIVFHTEYIFDNHHFNQLIKFCEYCYKEFDFKPTCVVMPSTNHRIGLGIKKSALEEAAFIDRVHALSEISTIGYHGHFRIKRNSSTFSSEIHCNNFIKNEIVEQFEQDIYWFKKNHISHNKIYSGGWWFFNEVVLDCLVKAGFKYDYSFSRSKWLSNAYFESLSEFKNTAVNTIQHGNKEGFLTFIENITGLSYTHVNEFERALIRNQGKKIIGSIHSHDDDYNLDRSKALIYHLIKKRKVLFCSHKHLINSIA